VACVPFLVLGIWEFFFMPASLENISFYSHGSRCVGTFFGPAGVAPFPTVLLLHGIPGTEKNWALAYALRDAGWAVLVVHYRGCWGSGGTYSLPGIVDDIVAGVDYLTQRTDVDATHLAGVGLSLGGWGVVMAAARDPRLRAIVSLNPLVTPSAQPLDDDTFKRFAAPLMGITPAEVKQQWLALTPLTEVAGKLSDRPTLLLTGDADELFPPDHIQPLAEAMPFAEWKRIPDARHMFGDHRTVLIRSVIDFLTLTFSPLPPSEAKLQLSPAFLLRPPTESDHPRVLAILSDWWGGRDLSHLLPRLYFQHFNDTSFIVEKDGALAAFLIGFMSQSDPRVGYIHFVGVHPAHRQAGLGRVMYERFFALARARGAHEVHCVTSPVNAGSIAFHTKLGFSRSASIPDYDAPGDDRVAFKKKL
jgi:pimeloyl-ACP methyl ester carboxylesterase/ribosomal protein S18 acetylase RimI-like enzyme